LTMLITSFAQKTIIAIACSLSLMACGPSREAPPRDTAVSVLNAPAPAATPAPIAQVQRAKKDSSLAEPKMNADVSAEVDSAVAADKQTAGGIPAAAITTTPAASIVGAKGRQLVLNASARFGVKNTYQSALAIEDAVVANDGYVVNNNIASKVLQNTTHRGDDGQLVRIAQVSITGEMVVRVPSHKTQAFLRDIASQIDALDQRNFAARDVQFDMLRTQLEALRSNESQTELGQLARQPGYVSEKGTVLEARSQAKAARDEARVVQAQLADQVAFSTIALSLYQPHQLRTTKEPDFESTRFEHRPGFISNLLRALASGWHGLLSTLVWAVSVWPLWLFLMALTSTVVIYRARRKPKSA
jgi:Domain of unknown function (DUF4349)